MAWYKTAQRLDPESEGIRDTYNVADVMRYVVDSFMIVCGISRTEQRVSIYTLINNFYLGLSLGQYYWTYDLDEEKSALKKYKEIKNIVKDIVDDFNAKETPSCLIDAHIRNALFDLDTDHRIRTNIPYINYSYRYKPEKDARSQIYGTRYPKYNEENFRQAKNNQGK